MTSSQPLKGTFKDCSEKNDMVFLKNLYAKDLLILVINELKTILNGDTPIFQTRWKGQKRANFWIHKVTL